jgi:hypothetical protein
MKLIYVRGVEREGSFCSGRACDAIRLSRHEKVEL